MNAPARCVPTRAALRMPAYARLRLAALRARSRNVTVEAPMLRLRGHISQLCSAEQAVAG